MAISIIQSNPTSTPFTGVTSGTATGSLATPVTSGNAVLIAFASAGNSAALTVGSVTDNTSNSYVPLTFDNVTTSGQGFYLLTNITNGPNTSFSAPFTCTLSSPTIVVYVYEIGGLALSASDYANLQTSGFSTSFNLSFTTTSANEYGFSILSNSNGSGQSSVTMSNGWTQTGTANAYLGTLPRSAFATSALPTSGSGNSINGSTGSADEWNVTIVSLKPNTLTSTASIAWVT